LSLIDDLILLFFSEISNILLNETSSLDFRFDKFKLLEALFSVVLFAGHKDSDFEVLLRKLDNLFGLEFELTLVEIQGDFQLFDRAGSVQD
jgi:cell fate regulator YaaT (PSP1 superfamily)